MNESDTDISFEFFKAITGTRRYYMCDFHKLKHNDGSVTYRVILQAFNQPDIVADVSRNETGDWQLTRPDPNLPADIELKILHAIDEVAV